MTQQDLRKENWLKVIFSIAQIYPCLGLYGGSYCVLQVVVQGVPKTIKVSRLYLL